MPVVVVAMTEIARFCFRWKPWIPPKLDQGLQQGGTFVFLGSQVIQARKYDALACYLLVLSSALYWFYSWGDALLQEVFSYYDPSTGAHADLNKVLKVALEAADAAAAKRQS